MKKVTFKTIALVVIELPFFLALFWLAFTAYQMRSEPTEFIYYNF